MDAGLAIPYRAAPWSCCGLILSDSALPPRVSREPCPSIVWVAHGHFRIDNPTTRDADIPIELRFCLADGLTFRTVFLRLNFLRGSSRMAL
jgi:hypothetical protein